MHHESCSLANNRELLLHFLWPIIVLFFAKDFLIIFSHVVLLFYFNRADLSTKKLYEKVSYLLPNNDSVLKVFRKYPFYMVYRFLSVNVLVNGLHSSRAESFLAMTLVSEILYDGGLPLGVDFNGFYQVRDKKRCISQNEVMVHDEDFCGVGDDSHVKFSFAEFVPPDFGDVKTFIRIACEDLNPDVGWYANELVGQLDQFIAGSEEEKNVACKVFNDLLEKEPRFNKIVSKIFHGKKWFQDKIMLIDSPPTRTPKRKLEHRPSSKKGKKKKNK